jgi:hypothetical protein
LCPHTFRTGILTPQTTGLNLKVTVKPSNRYPRKRA